MISRTHKLYRQSSQSNSDNCDCILGSKISLPAKLKKATKKIVKKSRSKPKKVSASKHARKAKAMLKKKHKPKKIKVQKKFKARKAKRARSMSKSKRTKANRSPSAKRPKRAKSISSKCGKPRPVAAPWRNRLRPRPLKSIRVKLLGCGKKLTLKNKKYMKKYISLPTRKYKKSLKRKAAKVRKIKSTNRKRKPVKKTKSKAPKIKLPASNESGKNKNICDYIPGCKMFRKYFCRYSQSKNANNSMKRRRAVIKRRGRKSRLNRLQGLKRRRLLRNIRRNRNIQKRRLSSRKIKKTKKRSSAKKSRRASGKKSKKVTDESSNKVCETEPTGSTNTEENASVEPITVDEPVNETCPTPECPTNESCDIEDPLNSMPSSGLLTNFDCISNVNNNRSEFVKNSIEFFQNMNQVSDQPFDGEKVAEDVQLVDEEVAQSPSRASQATEESESQIFGTELGDH